jgi:hypothetical protein
MLCSGDQTQEPIKSGPWDEFPLEFRRTLEAENARMHIALGGHPGWEPSDTPQPRYIDMC